MTRTDWLAHFDQLPQAAQAYLLSDAAVKNENAAQAKLAYENDAWSRLMDVVWDLFFLGLNSSEWKEEITKVKGDRTEEEVERAMLFNIVLPLADIVPWDVESRLQELGMKSSEIQQMARISMRPVSYGAAVRRICSNAKLSVLSEDLIIRLREIFVSYLKGARTIEQLTEILQRAQADGGMGLSKDQVAQFLAAMNEFVETTQIMSEQEYADWFLNYQRQAEQQRLEAEKPKPPAKTGDEADLATVGKPRTMFDGSASLTQGVEIAMSKIGALQLDEALIRRLENIVSTRLRDVRNSLQTKQVLMRETKVGGMGLAQAEADRIAAAIEEAYTQQRSQIEVEERERIQSVVIEQGKKVEERKKRESEEHARWFEEKVKVTRSEEVLREQYQKAQQAQVQAAAQPISAADQLKPRLDSVVPPPRLMGVEDELGSMTWASFRRQAKNPQDAAEKINQKLETLKAESFDRWTGGLEAWRKSPIQQDYLKLVTESFSAGKPVAQLVEEKRNTNPDLPTPEELGAIIALNARLQM